MRFVNRFEARSRFEGRTVAIVGSGPGSLGNQPELVDSHDLVVRVNNYKLSEATGFRCDVFYSFFGTSIKKPKDDLIRDGVTLCISKLPDADLSTASADNPVPLNSDWHRCHGQMIGLDYRGHYERRRRRDFWFCDTYVPTIAEFLVGFDLLGKHMPTTGFAAILDVLSFNPKAVFLTGFDFFTSGIHNVDEPHVVKNLDDPYRHRPDMERTWLMANAGRYPVTFDATLAALLVAEAA